MSLGSLFRNLFPFFFRSPGQQNQLPYRSEADLTRRKKIHNYERERQFKDLALGTIQIIVVIALLLLGWRLFTDQSARITVTDLLIQNIVGIVYVLLVIGGIKINKD